MSSPGICVAVAPGDLEDRVQERLPARAPSIARLRHVAVDFARDNGATQAQCDDVALAVSEALSNAVRHAYVGCDAPGMVELRASIERGRLIVLVCDEGDTMSDTAKGSPKGLGLAVIGRVTERYELTSREPKPGLQLRMVFAIG
jgi:anti-sigma regulatory factor (Ser/Thr protein kinase)